MIAAFLKTYYYGKDFGGQMINTKGFLCIGRTGKVDRKSGQKTRDAIIALISSNPHITTAQMSESLGINRSALSKHIKRMQEDGIIRRVGPDKGGFWEVISD